MIFKEWGVGCNIKLTLIGKFFSDFDIFYPEIIFFTIFDVACKQSSYLWRGGGGYYFLRKYLPLINLFCMYTGWRFESSCSVECTAGSSNYLRASCTGEYFLRVSSSCPYVGLGEWLRLKTRKKLSLSQSNGL